MSSKKFKTIFGILAIFMVALVTGITVGKLYVDSIPANLVVNMTEAELRDSDADIEKLVKKASSSNPSSFSAVELYEIAEYRLNHKDAFYKTSNGYAKNMVGKQTLRSYKLYRDGKFLFDNFSPGQIDIITRITYTDGEDDNVRRNTDGVWENGSKKKGKFNSAYDEVYTVEQYKKKFNCHPKYSVSYLISSKTCPQGHASNVTKTSDGNYTFKIKLDGTLLTAATCIYSYEIFYTSYGILTSEAKRDTILPAWKDSVMTVVIDSNFDFVSVDYDERYTVNTKFGYQAVNDVFREEYIFDISKMPTFEEVL